MKAEDSAAAETFLEQRREACEYDLCLVPEEADILVCDHAAEMAKACSIYGIMSWRSDSFCGMLNLMNRN